MKLSDFATLAEAQAYTETTGRMISPDMMTKFLTAYGLMSLVENSTSNEGIGLRYALSFGSEFNLINGHAENIEALLDALIFEFSAPATFKTTLINYANKVSQPFAYTTQAEFDAAQLEGESVATVTYDGGDKFVTAGKREFAFEATLISAAPRDINVSVTCQMSKGEGSEYLPTSRKWQFTIPQGSTGFIDSKLPVNGLYRWVQFDAVIDIANTDCTINVVGS